MKYRVVKKAEDTLFYLQYKRYWLSRWTDYIYETTNMDYDGFSHERPGFKSVDEAMSHAHELEKSRKKHTEISEALSIPFSTDPISKPKKMQVWNFDVDNIKKGTLKSPEKSKWWIERWFRLAWFQGNLLNNTVVCFSSEGCQGINVFKWVGKVREIRQNDDESLDAIIEIIKHNESYSDARDLKKREIYTRHLASKYTVTGDFQQVDGVWLLFV